MAHRLRQQRLAVASAQLSLSTWRSLVQDRRLKAPLRWHLQTTLSGRRRLLSSGRLRNRCVQSHRSRGVFRFARLSRLFLRHHQFLGRVPGLRKAYW